MICRFRVLNLTLRACLARPALGKPLCAPGRMFSDTAEINHEETISKLKALCTEKMAELENMRRLRGEEVEKAKMFSTKSFAKDMISAMDTLEMALKSVPEEELQRENNEALKELYKGLQFTHKTLAKSLEKHGVVAFDPIGDEFDSGRHMAVYHAPISGKKPGTIFDTRKVGYMHYNQILRAAEVGVVREAPPSQTN